MKIGARRTARGGNADWISKGLSLNTKSILTLEGGKVSGIGGNTTSNRDRAIECMWPDTMNDAPIIVGGSKYDGTDAKAAETYYWNWKYAELDARPCSATVSGKTLAWRAKLRPAKGFQSPPPDAFLRDHWLDPM